MCKLGGSYTSLVFDAIKNLRSPDGAGFYAGLYENTKQPNKSLTGNTNGLILEILHYKARANRPMIESDAITISQNTPFKITLELAPLIPPSLAKIELSYQKP